MTQVTPQPKVNKAKISYPDIRSLKDTRYIKCSWPEIQLFMDNKRWSECIFCMDIEGHPCEDNTYMIPEDLYNKVMRN